MKLTFMHLSFIITIVKLFISEQRCQHGGGCNCGRDSVNIWGTGFLRITWWIWHCFFIYRAVVVNLEFPSTSVSWWINHPGVFLFRSTFKRDIFSNSISWCWRSRGLEVHHISVVRFRNRLALIVVNEVIFFGVERSINIFDFSISWGFKLYEIARVLVTVSAVYKPKIWTNLDINIKGIILGWWIISDWPGWASILGCKSGGTDGSY